ncbi:MAG: type VI secretion system contractile sheath small subunit [Burkholderiales bacterium]|nr:type VI secretion system contractile sheath small subunit [Burkholderiales bacterium]
MSQESLQKKLGRTRPPRVQITYDVEIGQTTEKRELPLVIGVIGPFSGSQANDETTSAEGLGAGFVNVSRAHLDTCMGAVSPTLKLSVPKTTGHPEKDEHLNIELRFTKLSDFHPDHIVTQHTDLQRLVETREKLSELRNKLAGNPRLQKAVRQWMLETKNNAVNPTGDSQE